MFAVTIAHLVCEQDVLERLSPADAKRAAAFANPHRQWQFAAGRWLMRHAAQVVFGEEAFTLEAPPEGKPSVALKDGTRAAISLSHSRDLVLCAAGRRGAVGVDVEFVRPRRNWLALSTAVLHPEEQADLQPLPESERWQEFYRIWTLKEAIAKALGIGVFSLPLDQLLVRGGVLQQAPVGLGLLRGDWRLAEVLALPCAFAASVAWRL